MGKDVNRPVLVQNIIAVSFHRRVQWQKCPSNREGVWCVLLCSGLSGFGQLYDRDLLCVLVRIHAFAGSEYQYLGRRYAYLLPWIPRKLCRA